MTEHLPRPDRPGHDLAEEARSLRLHPIEADNDWAAAGRRDMRRYLDRLGATILAPGHALALARMCAQTQVRDEHLGAYVRGLLVGLDDAGWPGGDAA